MKRTVHQRIDDVLPIYYGWIITAGCLAIILSVFTINISFGVFFEHLLADFDSSRGQISLLFSVQTFCLYTSAAIVGSVIDRYGTRRLVIVGTCVLGIGMFITINADSIPVLFGAFSFVVGVGMGILYVIGFATVPRWFDRRRGVATAIATTGTGFATLGGPVAAAFLLSAFDWRDTYFFFTLASLATLIVVAVIIADNPIAADINYAPEFESRAPGERPVDESWRELLRATLPVVRSNSFRLLMLGWILIFVPLYIILVHIVAYSATIGLSSRVGVIALSIIGGMTIPGRVVFGVIGDRIGRTRLFVVLAFSMNTLILVLPGLRTPILIFGFAVIYGLFYGGAAAMLSPLVADLFGTRYLNTLYGIAALAFGIAAVFGPSAAGLTFDTLGSYTPIIMATGVMGLFGAACIALSARLRGIGDQ